MASAAAAVMLAVELNNRARCCELIPHNQKFRIKTYFAVSEEPMPLPKLAGV